MRVVIIRRAEGYVAHKEEDLNEAAWGRTEAEALGAFICRFRPTEAIYPIYKKLWLVFYGSPLGEKMAVVEGITSTDAETAARNITQTEIRSICEADDGQYAALVPTAYRLGS